MKVLTRKKRKLKGKEKLHKVIVITVDKKLCGLLQQYAE